MQIVPRTIKEKFKLYGKRNTYLQGNNSISVRIPTWNRSHILADRAIRSVIGQTYKNWELCIAGDYCTDNTEEILKKISDKFNCKIVWSNLPERTEEEKEFLKDPKMRWFTGPVRATNEATRLCSGDWVAHLDDDDSWIPDHLQTMLDFAIKGNYELVSSAYDGNGKKVGAEDGIGGCQTWLMRRYIADIFQYDPKCYKKKWNRVSDTDVAERMRKAGVRMGYLDKITAIVKPRPGETEIGLKAYK
jgi:glycosyltransferase involved in cell wall biosynthesis